MFLDCYRFFVHSSSSDKWPGSIWILILIDQLQPQLKVCGLSARQVRDNILSESIFPSPAGITWRRRAAAMIWTRETTAGRSYTLTSSGFPLTKACCVLCWEWGLSSLPLPRVSFHSQIQQHIRIHINSKTVSGTVIVLFENWAD